MDKVAQRAKISKLSIYRHFENKEALFSAALVARCHQFAPQALVESVDGSAEDRLMVVGSSPLRTLLSPEVRRVEATIMADKTNQKSLSKLHYEAGPAHAIAQIEALLRQLHAKAVLNVPDPLRSARLFPIAGRPSPCSSPRTVAIATGADSNLNAVGLRGGKTGDSERGIYEKGPVKTGP